MRGFLGGVSIGALVAVAGAAVWSLSTPLHPPVEVSGDTPAPILAPRDEGTVPGDTPQSDADLVEAAPVGPDQDASGSDGGPEGIDTDSAAKPDVTTDVDSRLSPDPKSDPGASPEIQAASDTPVATESLDTLTAPADHTDPSVPTETARLPEPATSAAPVIQPPDASADGPLLRDAEDNRTAAVVPPLVAAIEPPDLGDAPDTTLPPSIATPAPAPAVQSDQASVTDEDDSTTEPQDTRRIADLPQANGATDATANDGPRVGTPVIPLTERDKATTEVGTGMGADPASAAPFRKNAEPSDAPPGLPMMSIVLIEEEGAVGAEALEQFPYPLTFAIDPADPRATERMKARRAAGFEVMILADLPREASAQDAETALPIWFDRLPEAMGVLEGIETGVQGNRELADQISAIAADAGYGLVFQDNGLNTVQKMALRDGVPAGVVFRDFDGAGQDPRAMRRFLDQAAFRAGQEGAVVMLGRLKPDTISALLIWGLQDRASRVSLVPVSASLSRLLEPVGE
ncbi:divergent polysaccharide deacetylase family protein [Phaeobacter sp. B1627]|uniref:divergent polysaccharide deacteylase family protein n=1 Tax=Phaeobacter sp. B1627 TaxID=2583809 RepID=UPI00111A74E0|nr:divergent polysaccharide deacetylase family protein [Phaeobacter sp. B1627]TNJ46792.1 polysaccharide deacteylase family 2 protein [Phaeobacter sp. B1627]